LARLPGSYSFTLEGGKSVKPNYQYEKRQRDLAKKKKKEEKRLASLEKKKLPSEGEVDSVEAVELDGVEEA